MLVGIAIERQRIKKIINKRLKEIREQLHLEKDESAKFTLKIRHQELSMLLDKLGYLIEEEDLDELIGGLDD